MESSFSWLLFTLNVIAVLIGAFIAWDEKRLTHRQLGPVSLPYIWHAGMWADLLLISPIIGLIGPTISQWSPYTMTFWSISFMISLLCHHWWSKIQTIPGHIIAPQSGQGWHNLTVGGWYHLGYMTNVLAYILLYYTTRAESKILVSVLLSIFVIPATAGVGWYCRKVTQPKTNPLVTKLDASVIGVLWMIIWIVTFITR